MKLTGYVQVPKNKAKAEQLRDLYGAVILEKRPSSLEEVPEDKVLICCVDNGPFEAAGVCDTIKDFTEFERDDPVPDEPPVLGAFAATINLMSVYEALGMQRPRTYVLLDREVALELGAQIAD